MHRFEKELISNYYFEIGNLTKEAYKWLLRYYTFPKLWKHPENTIFNMVVLLHISPFLCNCVWTRSTPIVGSGEMAPFNGLLHPQIWRHVTTSSLNTWKFLYEVSILKNWRGNDWNPTGSGKYWRGSFEKSIQKHEKLFIFVLREVGGHFEQLLNIKLPLPFRVICITKRSKLLKTFKIKSSQLPVIISTPCF